MQSALFFIDWKRNLCLKSKVTASVAKEAELSWPPVHTTKLRRQKCGKGLSNKTVGTLLWVWYRQLLWLLLHGWTRVLCDLLKASIKFFRSFAGPGDVAISYVCNFTWNHSCQNSCILRVVVVYVNMPSNSVPLHCVITCKLISLWSTFAKKHMSKMVRRWSNRNPYSHHYPNYLSYTTAGNTLDRICNMAGLINRVITFYECVHSAF